jgi:hypothetical protein
MFLEFIISLRITHQEEYYIYKCSKDISRRGILLMFTIFLLCLYTVLEKYGIFIFGQPYAYFRNVKNRILSKNNIRTTLYIYIYIYIYILWIYTSTPPYAFMAYCLIS